MFRENHISRLKEAIRREDIGEAIRLLDVCPELLGVDLWPVAIYEARSLPLTRWLVDRGLDVNQCSAPRLPLHLAVYQCLPDIVAFLIEHGADVNRRNSLGETPLDLLDAYEPRPVGDPGARRIRELLRRAGASGGIFPAVRAGDVEEVRGILDRDPEALHATSEIGTPIFAAARSGRDEVLRLLAERGADVNQRNSAGNTPLWFACQSAAPAEDRLRVARHLLDLGADVHARCEEGSTALHLAAWRGPAAMVEFLLSRGARSWITDDKGKRPVDWARESDGEDKEVIVRLLGEVRIMDPAFREAVAAMDEGNLERLRQLLAQNPSLVHQRAEEEGWFAGPYFRRPALLHFVAHNPTRFGTLPLNICEIAQAIIDAGADVDACTEGGRGHTTVALVASSEPARKSNLQIPLLELLVRNGADPANGLDAAILHNEMAAVKALVRLGASHTLSSAAGIGDEESLRDLLRSPASESDRLTAASVAAMHGCLLCLDILLATGVDLNARIPNHPFSPTLLHQAAWAGHRPIVEKLLAMGADPTLRDTQYNGTPADWARVAGHLDLSQLIAARGNSSDPAT